MKVKFYLARPDAVSQTAIYASASYNGHRVKIPTGESIAPGYWNEKAHKIKSTNKFPEHPEFNARLDKIASAINKVYLKFLNDNDTAPEPDVLKKLAAVAIGRSKEVKTTFLQFFTDFIYRQVNGLRVNPKTSRPIKSTNTKHHQHTLNTLNAYAEATGNPIDWKDLDLQFYNDYTRYLQQSGIKLNTTGAHIRRLKTVLSEALHHGHPVNLAYKSPYFLTVSEAADNIYLSEEELQAVIDLNLSGSKRLDVVRDLFTIGCYTAQRFSDVVAIRPKDIKDGFIKITQIKTDKVVTIPVHPEVQRILDKYGGKLPAGYTNQKTNQYLKEIGQMVPALQAKESKRSTKGNTKVVETLHRWEMLSTHCMRRTFATLEYLRGTEPITIMAVTGHTTFKNFMAYIRATADDHAHKLQKKWATDAARQQMKVV